MCVRKNSRRYSFRVCFFFFYRGYKTGTNGELKSENRILRNSCISDNIDNIRECEKQILLVHVIYKVLVSFFIGTFVGNVCICVSVYRHEA